MILIWTTSIHGDLWSFMAYLGQLICLHFRAFLRQCCHVDDGTMWIFHLWSQLLLCSTEFVGQAGQNWTLILRWYWAKSHLSNRDSGWIVLQHAVPNKELWNFTTINFWGANGEPINLLLRALHKTGIWELCLQGIFQYTSIDEQHRLPTFKSFWYPFFHHGSGKSP